MKTRSLSVPNEGVKEIEMWVYSGRFTPKGSSGPIYGSGVVCTLVCGENRDETT